MEFVTALLTQISWTNYLAIMSKAKTVAERHFYITLCVKESYLSRELERQIDSGYYERYMLSKEKLLQEPIKGLKENPFLDSYVIEFLDLPKNFKEVDLRKGLIQNMKDFILEVGKDFTFIDEEYRVQVGGEDFRIDLLFFHRGLQCLVAFELKIGKFKPEYISKMDFYLEALDRQKKNEESEVIDEQKLREDAYREKVIKTFFEYGKLKAIPAQRKKQRICLEEIAKAFEFNKEYDEKEVNEIILKFHDDFCTIRRDMISEHIMERDSNVYRLK